MHIIRTAETPALSILKVEGRIVSEWVGVLANESLALLQQSRSVVLDFSGVQYIDARGLETLKQIQTCNVRIVNCPALIQDMLNEEVF